MVPATGMFAVSVLLGLALCGLLLLFRDSLALMLASWASVKHMHGWLMPGLAVVLLRLRPASAEAAGAGAGAGAWMGLALLLLGAMLQVFGELSAVYTISQFGFVLALCSLLLSLGGWAVLSGLWLPLLCLLFMLPLPQFLANQLIAFLQLLPALAATGLIRTAGLAAVLEGNLLDVGIYQVPVTEASSSMLMCLPLLSIALPAAVLYRGPWWRRVVLLMSALLIPALFAVLRLAGTAWLARHQGVDSAAGFLQRSSGVPLYLACAGLLALLIGWSALRTGQTLAGAYGLNAALRSSWAHWLLSRPAGRPLWTVMLVTGLLALGSVLVSRPSVQIPERQRFAAFPRQIAGWQARTAHVDPAALASLQLADHLALFYQQPADPVPVSLWVAWYDRQVHGVSIHSPMACLPGAGWRVETLGLHEVPGRSATDAPLRVNRAIITLGTQRQLVYYWFSQRGRALTSEYLLKWYLFQDGLLMQRSDGALIRLTTELADLADTAAADARLSGLMRAIMPVLPEYVPGAVAVLRDPLLNKP